MGHRVSGESIRLSDSVQTLTSSANGESPLGLRAQFERDGFLLLPDFVDRSMCDELRSRAADLIGAYVPDEDTKSIFTTVEQERNSDAYFLVSGDKIRFFYEPESFDAEGELRHPVELSINKIGHALHDLDPVFGKFSRSDKFAELAAALGVGDHVLLQSMYIFKQPLIGGEVDCHTDHTFLWTDPVSVTGYWVALEDATIENGCLWALPGYHRMSPKKRFIRSDESGTDMVIFDSEPFPMHDLVPLEAKAGTLIVLHGLLPHLSGANRSPVSRHAYTVHTIDPKAEYSELNWLQRGEALPLRGFSS